MKSLCALYPTSCAMHVYNIYEIHFISSCSIATFIIRCLPRHAVSVERDTILHHRLLPLNVYSTVNSFYLLPQSSSVNYHLNTVKRSVVVILSSPCFASYIWDGKTFRVQSIGSVSWLTISLLFVSKINRISLEVTSGRLHMYGIIHTIPPCSMGTCTMIQ